MIEETLFWIIIIVVMLWELIWKGVALWKCGRNNHLIWFIFILIFNTAGILPIIYIVFFSKKKAIKKKIIKKKK
jgi:hypothetical protein